MLTPVEEHEKDPFSDDDDDDNLSDTVIISSTSNKIDGVRDGSRPSSSLSNQEGVIWMVDSEVSSMKDNMSILSGGDGEQQGKVTILREDSARKECSQSSDEDSHLFSASVHTLLRGGPASPTDSETPSSKRVSDISQQHDIFTDPSFSSPRFHPYHKRSSLRDNCSGSQCSSPLSPTSRATVSSQSSYSEMMGDDGEAKLRKYSTSDKYARYEAYRASLSAVASQSEKESSAQMSTQESSSTLIDETVGEESGDTKQASPTKSEEGVEFQPNKDVSDRKLLDIKDSLKHCDSGIDDTPEAHKEGVRRLSMPPSGDDCHVTETKPLSYTSAFASRESGLADSPDPEMLADEAIVQKTQRVHASDSAEQQLKAMVKLNHSPEVEIFVPLGDDSASPETEDPGRRIRARSEKLSSSYSMDRPNTVPRSLEHSSFSRYARTPIRDSRMLQAGGSLRYRSVSMDKIPNGFDGAARGDKGIEARAHSMSNSKSAMISPFYSPTHHPPPPAQAKNIHPNQRFCVKKDTPPSTPTTPSSTTSHPNLHDDTTTSNSSPFGSPVTSARNKRGRGIRERLKPALRVLKINSSPSLFLKDPLHEVDEQTVPVSPLDSFADDSSLKETTPSSASVGQNRRVRMMSPEALATHLHSSSNSLRRSQSSEDILESGAFTTKEAEGVAITAKIGSLVVVPEPKYKYRGKFLEKLRSKRGSPSLSRGGHHSVSADGIFSEVGSVGSRSPKYKKRHRTPHFV